jgi:hypothetical protein
MARSDSDKRVPPYAHARPRTWIQSRFILPTSRSAVRPTSCVRSPKFILDANRRIYREGSIIGIPRMLSRNTSLRYTEPSVKTLT